MGFQHGLSGLNAASTNLDVIGNNIANANTAGFKQSHAQFTDILANSMGGSGSSQVGIGSKVSTIAQSFSQGGISPTNNPLDIAINGQGFFRMSEGGVISYTRDGQFKVDESGFLTNAKGTNLTGYIADANGVIDTSNQVNLKLTTADLPPKVTSAFDWGFTLDSRKAAIPASTTFSVANGDSYTNTQSGTIIDSLGNSHVLAIYFRKSDAAANTWNAYTTVDGKIDGTGLPVGVTLDGGASTTLAFDGQGALTPSTKSVAVSVDLAAIDSTLGATSPLNFTLDLSKTKQYGSDFAVTAISQDGYPSSRLAGFTTAADGVIQGSYSNGETRALGQIVLANFVNPQGLNPIGDGRWVETSSSGQPLVGPPGTGTLGVLQSSAIEDANVDLTSELVKMITAQRMYQANAKSIETQDAVLQTLVNL